MAESFVKVKDVLTKIGDELEEVGYNINRDNLEGDYLEVGIFGMILIGLIELGFWGYMFRMASKRLGQIYKIMESEESER